MRKIAVSTLGPTREKGKWREAPRRAATSEYRSVRPPFRRHSKLQNRCVELCDQGGALLSTRAF